MSSDNNPWNSNQGNNGFQGNNNSNRRWRRNNNRNNHQNPQNQNQNQNQNFNQHQNQNQANEQANNSNRPGHSPISCTICNKRGHTEATCWSAPGNSRGNGNGNGNNIFPSDLSHPNQRNNICPHCGNTGHRADDCAVFLSHFQAFQDAHAMSGLESTGSSSIPVNSATYVNLFQQFGDLLKKVEDLTQQAAVAIAGSRMTPAPAPAPPCVPVVINGNSGGCNCSSSVGVGRGPGVSPSSHAHSHYRSRDGKIQLHSTFAGSRLTGNTPKSNRQYGIINPPSSLRTNYINGLGFVPPSQIPYNASSAPDLAKPCLAVPRSVEQKSLLPPGCFQVPGMGVLSVKTSFVNGVGNCVGEAREVRVIEDGEREEVWVYTMCGCVGCRRLFDPRAVGQIRERRRWLGEGEVVFRFT